MDIGSGIILKVSYIFVHVKMCWELAEDAQPEITCPLTFNWFPFDTQHCYLVMSISPYKIKLVSRKIEELLVAYQQNTILEYKVHVLELPADKKKVEISQVYPIRILFMTLMKK